MLSDSGALNIGNNASTTAVFSQTGGTVTAASVALGYASGSTTTTATYNLGGGTLSTGSVTGAGSNLRTELDFNGGTLAATGNSTTFVSGLTTAAVIGTATINTNGFNVTIPQALTHGGQAAIDGGLTKTGTGTLTLSGANSFTGNTTVAAGTLNVASTTALQASTLVTAAAGTVTFDPSLEYQTVFIGGLAGNGTLNLQDTATVPDEVDVNVGGNNASTTFAGTVQGLGELVKVGTGTLTVTGVTGDTSASGGTIVVPAGGTVGNTGTDVFMNASAAKISVTGGTVTAFYLLANAGLFDQASGTVSALGIQVGGYNATATYNLHSGSVTASRYLYLADATSATAVFTQSGGTLTTAAIYFDSGSSSATPNESATFNLNGGVVSTGLIAFGTNASNSGGGGVGTFNFNGGLLQATADSGTFMGGLTAANVQTGGARIDTNGHNITISQPLLHDQTTGAPAADGGLTKTGAGNLTLSGAGTYTGPTTILGGTVTVTNPTALSGSTVTLNGGKLGLGDVATLATTPTQSGFANVQLNPSAATSNGPTVSTDNSTLTITTRQNNEANSAFFTQKVTLPAAGFYARFTWQHDTGADGFAFVLQNDPRGAGALGDNGGALGYGTKKINNVDDSIASSAAVQFSIYTYGGTGLGTNGTISDTTAGAVNTRTDTNPLNVSLVYIAPTQTLSETVTDSVTNQSESFSYSVNLATVLGGPTAYLGFTGGTGDSVSTQLISGFSFGSVTAYSPISIANAVASTANTTSGIELNPTTGHTVASIGSLTLAAGSVVAIDSVAVGTATHGVLVIPTLSFPGTTTAPGATLDIQNNALDLPGTTLARVTALVAAAYANNTWAGPGITSSTAAANTAHNTAVGVISNTTAGGTQLYGSGTGMTLFDGAAPAATDILVKYTYFGDANLDGKVDGSDYTLIDNGFNQKLTGWYNGDFNYDGKVDGSDYTLIDNAFNTQATSLASSGLFADTTDQVAGPAAVPEPASIAAATAVLASLVRRRRAGGRV